jgi:hypothetical protein
MADFSLSLPLQATCKICKKELRFSMTEEFVSFDDVVNAIELHGWEYIEASDMRCPNHHLIGRFDAEAV